MNLRFVFLGLLALAGCASGSDQVQPGETGSYSRDPRFAETVHRTCHGYVADTTAIEWNGFTQKLVVTCKNGTVAIVRVPNAVLENK